MGEIEEVISDDSLLDQNYEGSAPPMPLMESPIMNDQQMSGSD
jgi:hypothetical protein